MLAEWVNADRVGNLRLETLTPGKLDALGGNYTGVDRPAEIAVTLDARYDAPSKVSLDSGFVVKITLEIDTLVVDSIPGVWVGRFVLTERDVEFLRADMRERLRVSLWMADVEFEPKVGRPLDPSLSATWSLKAQEWGTYPGVIMTTVEAPSFDTTLARDSRTDIMLLGSPRTFTLSDVQFWVDIEAPRSLPGTLASFAFLLGLTVPATGLVMFFWKWGDRRREREEKENKEQEPVTYGTDGRAL